MAYHVHSPLRRIEHVWVLFLLLLLLRVLLLVQDFCCSWPRKLQPIVIFFSQQQHIWLFGVVLKHVGLRLIIIGDAFFCILELSLINWNAL